MQVCVAAALTERTCRHTMHHTVRVTAPPAFSSVNPSQLSILRIQISLATQPLCRKAAIVRALQIHGTCRLSALQPHLGLGPSLQPSCARKGCAVLTSPASGSPNRPLSLDCCRWSCLRRHAKARKHGGGTLILQM